ncbi:glycosyltransferase [Ohtaekwangia sp.]|uniref:glycosyltransferase n=1 Tax=Ohtaekwangia sp. TaxID=2066019 RepID=UPI002FDCBFEF
MKKYDLTVSLVLFKSNPAIVGQAIDSVYKSSLNFKLYLIDNSPTNELQTLKKDDRTEYIFNNKNLGFGKAHNIALRRAVEESSYHLVLNPDIYFHEHVLEDLFQYMEKNKNIGQVMPKILYPDGSVQHLCKLLPTPTDLLLRRFFSWLPGFKERNKRYELIDSGYNKIMNIPYLSGCFMFLRSESLQKVGFFDEAIFMYIEDADLTRRIHQQYQTIFYPAVQVYHYYAKGSYKNFKLMLYNIHGAAVYFTKWGWLFDSERKKINQQIVNEYLNLTDSNA